MVCITLDEYTSHDASYDLIVDVHKATGGGGSHSKVITATGLCPAHLAVVPCHLMRVPWWLPYKTKRKNPSTRIVTATRGPEWPGSPPLREGTRAIHNGVGKSAVHWSSFKASHPACIQTSAKFARRAMCDELAQWARLTRGGTKPVPE